MKLDKTLEEITTYNKSLNNTTGEVTLEYFRLRKSNDKRIAELKSVQKDEKSKLIYDMKQLKNVSLQKIDYNVSIYKADVKEENVISFSNKAYESMINTFDYNISKYYDSNKEIIIDYISKIYKMQLEMKKLNKELSFILSKFVKDNNINTYRLARLVKSYQEIKNDLKIYDKFCSNIEDFKKLQFKEDKIISFHEEFFLEEINEIEAKRTLNKICKEADNEKEMNYKARLSKEYTPKIGNNSKEFILESMKSSKLEELIEESLLKDEEISSSITVLKELENKTMKEPKKIKTKEEKAILKHNKAVYAQAMKGLWFN